MRMTHPTCWAREHWRADVDAEVARQSCGCARCRGVLASVAKDSEELERDLPTATFIARLEAHETGVPTPAPLPSTTEVTEAAEALEPSAAVQSAARALEFDPHSGLIWMSLPGERVPLGDPSELKLYLEGAWLEAWYAGPGGDEDPADAALHHDVQAVLGQLEPQLEALGWGAPRVEAPAAPVSVAPRARPRRSFGAGWRHAGRAALVAAPLAVVLVVARASLLGTSPLPAPPSAGQLGSARSVEGELVAKGTRGQAPVVVIVRRGGTTLEYDDAVTVMPGDRLRLRFHRDTAGPVAAGIWTDAGEWVPFFQETRFDAGDHAPEATLRVDEQPASGRVLVGEPRAVQAMLAGVHLPEVAEVRLVWAPVTPTR